MMFKCKYLAIIVVIFSLTGCVRPFHLDIQQGNILSPENIASIRYGMTEEDVVHLLGTPVLDNVFADGERLYVYTFQPGYGHRERRRLLLYFRGDYVSHIAFANDIVAH